MAAYFFFMARKMALVDMLLHVLEIIVVRLDVLVDLLVMLVKVVNAVGMSMTGR